MGWQRFFRRGAWDEERARELESYIDIETRENLARGMTAQDARDRARRKLGNLTRIREEIYDMNTVPILDALWQDLRYGVRSLRTNPGFAAVAILSLALGMGANTAIFEMLNAVRLRTLPVRAPQELVEVRITHAPHGRSGQFRGPRPQISYPLWDQIRRRQQSLAGTFAWGAGRLNLNRGGEARYAQGLWASGELFGVLGVRPALGRVLTPSDDVRDCASPPAVISYSFWQREYGASSSVVGREIRLENRPFEIVGVTAPEFFGLQVGHRFDVAIPLCAEPLVYGEASGIAKPSVWWLAVAGRLKPGVPQAQAASQLKSISHAVFEATLPATYAAQDAKDYQAFELAPFPMATGVSPLRVTYENPLWLLLAMTGVVLVIACANLANLLLARASARQAEIGVRLAIGASRGRLIRQLLAESLLLALLGAAFGVLLAGGMSRSLVAFLSTADSPLFLDLAMDWRVFGFTAAVAVFACVCFGLAPAVRATRATAGAIMKGGGRASTETRERLGLRRALVVVQVALSVVLVAGALLFAASFRNLVTLDAGFRQDGIVAAYLDLGPLATPVDRRAYLQRDLLDRLRSAPVVDSVAQADVVPVSGSGWNERIRLEPTQQPMGVSNANRVSAGYFRTMGSALLAGRDFDDRDTVTSPKVAIVNEVFVRRFLGPQRALGRTFHLETGPGEPDPAYRVVGVVKDTKYGDLREAYTPIFYLAASQSERPDLGLQALIRSRAPLSDVVAAVKRAVGEVSPRIVIEFHALRVMVQESLLRERLMATLCGFFAGLAGLLATVGLYGVTSYMVVRRRNEIGIRMALGADRGVVLKLVMRDAGTLLGVGVIAGGVLAVAAGRAAASLLFGITPWDPATIGVTVGTLALVGAVASFVPARRAARLNPLDALREE